MLWVAPDRASATKLILQEPAAARALAVELHAFATALDDVLDLRPRIVRDISSVSPYWIALSALLDWTRP